MPTSQVAHDAMTTMTTALHVIPKNADSSTTQSEFTCSQLHVQKDSNSSSATASSSSSSSSSRPSLPLATLIPRVVVSVDSAAPASTSPSLLSEQSHFAQNPVKGQGIAETALTQVTACSSTTSIRTPREARQIVLADGKLCSSRVASISL